MYFNFKKKISSILLAAAFVTGLFVPAYAANEVEVFMKDVTSESEVLAGEAKIAISAKGSGTMNIAQIGFTVEGDMVCKSLESKVDAPDDVRSSLRVLPGKESDQLYVSMAYGAPAIQLNENTETELCVLTFSGDVDDEVTLTLIEDEDSYFTPNYPADKQTLEAVAGDDGEETAQAADTGANAVNAKVTLEMNKVQDIQLDTDTYKNNPINISITGEGENPIVFITDFENLSTATAKILELNTKLLDTMTYTVEISAVGYKTYTANGQTLAQALSLSNDDFVPGDVNADGTVDGVDKAEFNKIKNNGEYKVNADFDRNGEVDENDARVFEGIEEALTKPAKMSRPTVTGGSYQITVNWTAPADTSITGYILKYGASSVNLSTRLELGANERQKTIESLSAGTTYYVAIAAVNAAGEGEFSDVVNGATSASVPGGNPGGGGGGGGAGGGGSSSGGSSGGGGGAGGGGGFAPSTPSTNPNEPFTDLGNYGWAKESIYKLKNKGIISGTSDTEYSPASNIKRGDFMLILTRMLKTDVAFEDNFADVPTDKYYYNAIGMAKAIGIASGDGANFMPENSITRQDLITLAYRAFLNAGYIAESTDTTALDAFGDKAEITDYAVNPMASMVAAGIINGSDGNVNPKGNATRAEVAVMCARLVDLMN